MTKRIAYLDLTKLWAIFLVCMGHAFGMLSVGHGALYVVAPAVGVATVLACYLLARLFSRNRITAQLFLGASPSLRSATRRSATRRSAALSGHK